MQVAESKVIFEEISNLRVGVIGDFAVDFYFELVKNTAEFSLETNREVWWAGRPRTSLGAAGNVVQNMTALGAREISAFGAVGDDVFGRELISLLQDKNVDTKGVICPEKDWDTCTYTKPMQGRHERNRLDFGTHNELSPADFTQIIDRLEAKLPQLDVLIINQQFAAGLLTEARFTRLNALLARHSGVYALADMRTGGLLLRNATLKVNNAELARLSGQQGPEKWTTADCVMQGKALAKKIEGPVLITRAEQGLLYVDSRDEYECPAVAFSGPIDPVGAGDAAVAAFAACMGAKVEVPLALELANLAAAVTVQKLNQTGTASPEEIMELLAGT